jgi:hypothetical protein
VENGGIEIIDGRFVYCRLNAELVALTVAETFLDAGTGEEAGESTRVVVATGAVAAARIAAVEELDDAYAFRLCLGSCGDRANVVLGFFQLGSWWFWVSRRAAEAQRMHSSNSLRLCGSA